MEHVANTHPVLSRKQRHCPGNRIITNTTISLPLISYPPENQKKGANTVPLFWFICTFFSFTISSTFSLLTSASPTPHSWQPGLFYIYPWPFPDCLFEQFIFAPPPRAAAPRKSPSTPLKTDFHFVSSSSSRLLDVPLRTFSGFGIGVADEVYFMASVPPTTNH